MAIYELTESIPSKISKSDILNCSYSGDVVSIRLPKGTYKLECWGAQGGNALNYGALGGQGGYSCGTLTLNNKTLLHLYVGEKGYELEASDNTYGDGVSQISQRAFNGGGYGFAKDYKGYSSYFAAIGSGGGSSDIRINTDSIYSRIIVAGGGGGAAYLGGYNESGNGGAGGGIEGLSGEIGSSNFKSYYARGGTQTSGGTGTSYAYDYGTTDVQMSNGYTVSGTFYYGADMSLQQQSGSWSSACGGGGGGWYGGAAGCKNSGGGGGGSGYVYTESTASNYPEGCLLNSSYYLTDAETIAGNQSITSPDGSTTTGNSGNGYIRITVIELEQLPLWIKENNVWTKGSKLYIKNSGIWEILESSQIENTISAKKINKPKYVWKKFENLKDSNTKLLLHFDEIPYVDNDNDGITVTSTGTASITDSGKFSKSAIFPADGSHYIDVEVPNLTTIMNTNQWTFDWWEYGLGFNQDSAVFILGSYEQRTMLSSYAYTSSSGKQRKYFYASSNGSSWDLAVYQKMGDYLDNQWVHKAIVRNGTSIKLFSDGILITEITSSDLIKTYNDNIRFGYCWGGLGMNGYLDEFRFSDIPRWSENFTPPTEPYNYTLIGYAESENSNAYPDNGLADDGYYYKKL